MVDTKVLGHALRFGFAAYMMSLAFTWEAHDEYSVVFLHSNKFESANSVGCEYSMPVLHNRPIVLQRKNYTCYKDILNKLKLDMVLSIY